MPATIPPGYKYAVTAIPSDALAPEVADAVQLSDDLCIARELPIVLPEHWEKWLGHFQMRRIHEADLFLVAARPSRATGVLDEENDALEEYLKAYYYGLLVGVPGMGHADGLRLTGAVDDDEVNVRRVGELPKMRRLLGAPRWRIYPSHLREASRIAKGIDALRGPGEHDRTWRVVHAFYSALRAPEAGVRLQPRRIADGPPGG